MGLSVRAAYSSSGAAASRLDTQNPVSPVGEPAMPAHSIKFTACLGWQPLDSGAARNSHDSQLLARCQLRFVGHMTCTGRDAGLWQVGHPHTRSSSAEKSRLALRCHGMCATQEVLHRSSLCSPRRCERSWTGTTAHRIFTMHIASTSCYWAQLSDTECSALQSFNMTATAEPARTSMDGDRADLHC